MCAFILYKPDKLCIKCKRQRYIGLNNIKVLLLKYGFLQEEVDKITEKDLITVTYCSFCKDKNDTKPQIFILKNARSQ